MSTRRLAGCAFLAFNAAMAALKAERHEWLWFAWFGAVVLVTAVLISREVDR